MYQGFWLISQFGYILPPLTGAYNATSTSVSADSAWSKLWIFSFLQSKQKCLSCIHTIVSSPYFTPSSIAQTVNDCAATLPAAEFSKLLQQPNIEGHTALYWAIVNNRREALWVFMNFIPKLLPASSSDLRLACMMVSDHTLFTQLDVSEKLNPEDDSLRHFLGCPLDEIQVQELDNGCFIASFQMRSFQKRLRITLGMGIEFVARGMWSISFIFLALIGICYSLQAVYGCYGFIWDQTGSGMQSAYLQSIACQYKEMLQFG
ncbi:hypothetical protein DFJ58DRAFT_667355 [Suillus subalutaceus]|uniref:uncharacterized protein n=1 Tax=Suillus subalutaceus TaxID=48586 RepID=UPI001B88700F|nr:uncharacterized protein DFJ58DRAFT_667355 [Suillus subalutaceus]KAG1840065.1 hypothetical protein DFJ58DRAFT_667355 [Suillus subalutaceus]